VAGPCEHGNALSDCTKSDDFYNKRVNIILSWNNFQDGMSQVVQKNRIQVMKNASRNICVSTVSLGVVNMLHTIRPIALLAQST
jgi:hypothetical protein